VAQKGTSDVTYSPVSTRRFLRDPDALRQEAVADSPIAASVPAELKHICRNLPECVPAARYATAGEPATDLRRLGGGLSGQRKVSGPGEGERPEVWTAANGREAIDLYREHREDIAAVLLDVRMPGLDGPETLGALRNLNPEVLACSMSGDTSDSGLEELRQDGAVYVIVKPFLVCELTPVLWLLAQGVPADRLPSGGQAGVDSERIDTTEAPVPSICGRRRGHLPQHGGPLWRSGVRR
jgi:CheY-like chemotaxis protein